MLMENRGHYSTHYGPVKGYALLDLDVNQFTNFPPTHYVGGNTLLALNTS
jgi:hypothetical protein